MMIFGHYIKEPELRAKISRAAAPSTCRVNCPTYRKIWWIMRYRDCERFWGTSSVWWLYSLPIKWSMWPTTTPEACCGSARTVNPYLSSSIKRRFIYAIRPPKVRATNSCMEAVSWKCSLSS